MEGRRAMARVWTWVAVAALRRSKKLEESLGSTGETIMFDIFGSIVFR